MAKCSRCGSKENIEIHHRVPKFQNGGNEPENLLPLCQACHDYTHARMQIQAWIDQYTEDDERRAVWEVRKCVNEAANTPAIIRKTHQFVGYYQIETNTQKGMARMSLIGGPIAIDEYLLAEFQKTEQGRMAALSVYEIGRKSNYKPK